MKKNNQSEAKDSSVDEITTTPQQKVTPEYELTNSVFLKLLNSETKIFGFSKDLTIVSPPLTITKITDEHVFIESEYVSSRSLLLKDYGLSWFFTVLEAKQKMLSIKNRTIAA